MAEAADARSQVATSQMMTNDKKVFILIFRFFDWGAMRPLFIW